MDKQTLASRISGRLAGTMAHRHPSTAIVRKRRPCRFVVLAFSALLLATEPLSAAPAYSVFHNSDGFGNTGPSESVGPQATPVNYEFGYQQTYFTGANYGSVYASAGPGSIGITATTFNIGVYAPQRQEVYAGFDFDVFFESPNSDPIDVIMNLELSGSFSNPNFVSNVQVYAGNYRYRHSGIYFGAPQTPNPQGSGMLAGFSAGGSPQTISTGVIANVPVNMPTRMSIQLVTNNGYAPQTSTISFGSTLTFATTGDVFTVLGPDAALIGVNSIDADIVDNRFTVVPLPASLPLLGAGFIWLARRRRPRSRTVTRQ